MVLVVLDNETVQSLGNILRYSYVSQALVVTFLLMFLNYARTAWRSHHFNQQTNTLPPVNPHMHYKYGVSQMQGRRPYMEDRFAAVSNLNGDTKQSFYGIFDGHGGVGAADYCVKAMCHNVIRDHEMLEKKPLEALKQGFLNTDKEYLAIANRMNAEDGTTAVVVLVQDNILHFAHAGDSRAILVYTDGNMDVLTRDHKPNRSDEKERITDIGGSVVFWGVWRVEGILAVSRALGDRMLKPFVIAEPEVRTITRSKDHLFVVLASDGVWDVVSNEDAASIVHSNELLGPQAAALALMNMAYERGSMDNICAMVIDLREETKNDMTHSL